MPGEVRNLTSRLDLIEPQLGEALAVSDSLRRGQSIEISWECLRLARTDTTIFRASKLACGEAFHRSRMESDVWATLIPPKVIRP
jgi:hypothetical protein